MENVPYHRAVLADELQRRNAKNVRYSARAFARSLSLHPSTLCRIMQGKQALSMRSCKRILGSLALGPDERQAFVASLVTELATRTFARTDQLGMR